MSERLLSPRLQSLLSRSRLRLNTALPLGGQGDRSSRAKGSGLEFAEHRPYQPGDDLKHVDPHLEARLGETFIRQYSVDQQLPVNILLDVSASMGQEEPTKLDFAKRLVAAVSFLALTGNDRVRLASLQDGRVLWSEWFSGPRNADRLFGWLDNLTAGGETDLGSLVRQAAAQLPPTGLVLVVSDWLAQDSLRVPALLRREGRSVLCLHIYSPTEADPALLGQGSALRVIDSETGEEFDVALNEQAIAEYRLAWQEFTDSLREGLLARNALYLPVHTDSDLEGLLLKDWTRLGLVMR